jgi:hypothetical protein
VLSKHFETNVLSVPSANDIDLSTRYTKSNIFSLSISLSSGYAKILNPFSRIGGTISLSNP